MRRHYTEPADRFSGMPDTARESGSRAERLGGFSVGIVRPCLTRNRDGLEGCLCRCCGCIH